MSGDTCADPALRLSSIPLDKTLAALARHYAVKIISAMEPRNYEYELKNGRVLLIREVAVEDARKEVLSCRLLFVLQ